MTAFALVWPALCTGTGLALVGAYLLRPRVSRLEMRLEPHLALHVESIKRSVWDRTVDWCGTRLGRLLGGTEQVKIRLEQAGQPPDVDRFRTQQAIWGMAALAAASCISVLSGANGDANVLSATGLLIFSGVTGVVAKDHLLTQAAQRRQKRMISEFPTVADMLALAVAAGQGPLGALEHVTALCRGPLSTELSRALREARAGMPLADALSGVARRTSVLSIQRFVEGVIVALERGTPLADVLRAQAQDAREAARGELIEAAGQKEVLMMAPVVFLILPVTILFAVYPGLAALDLSL